MKTITIQDIKKHGSKSISGNEPIYLIVNSKPKCVMIPVDRYEMIMDELEELEDMITIEERKNEETVPMEEASSWFE
ncbi:type II toxin-antitoxin system Phd/YefM family antitoxin [Patescibacteria group bacterium]|nr:type II toxin-antitoxin system Phd/YefM family antitoxin [Patescibacteria group bacterium]